MSDFETRRRVMVDSQVRPSDVTKYPIIEAMLSVPRERFVPSERIEVAYMDESIQLDEERFLIQPRVFARLVDAVGITKNSLVLIVGAGTGYGAAVIARIAEAVIALEPKDELRQEAERILPELGADNVAIQSGDASEGAPEFGPFDVILIEGGIEFLPPAIEEQLAEGGRIAAVFMDGPLGKARIGVKINGSVSWRYVFDASIEIIPGFHRTQHFML